MTLTHQHYRSKPAAASKDADKPKFPAARYFQVHFEHLYTQLDDTRQCLRELQQQVSELNGRLASNTELTHLDAKK